MTGLSGDGGDDAVAAGFDDGALRSLERRHALWGLTVLVLLAVLVIAVTIFFTGTPGSRPDQHIRLGIPTAIPTVGPTPTGALDRTGGATTPPDAASTRPPRRGIAPADRTTAATRSSTTRGTPANRATAPAPPPTTRAGSRPAPRTSSNARTAPCAGSAPCALPGDHGVRAALDAARAQRGVGPATLSVTAAAQQCAVAGGGCDRQFALAFEPAPDGAQAVADLLRSAGAAWLVSAGHGAFAVGWAYHPQTGRYTVAILPA